MSTNNLVYGRFKGFSIGIAAVNGIPQLLKYTGRMRRLLVKMMHLLRVYMFVGAVFSGIKLNSSVEDQNVIPCHRNSGQRFYLHWFKLKFCTCNALILLICIYDSYLLLTEETKTLYALSFCTVFSKFYNYVAIVVTEHRTVSWPNKQCYGTSSRSIINTLSRFEAPL